MALVDLFLGVVRAFVFVYDIVTYPVYRMIQQPWEERTSQKLGPVRENATSLVKE